MLKLGNTDINKIYLNDSEVTKILLGETQVYPVQSALEKGGITDGLQIKKEEKVEKKRRNYDENTTIYK